MTTVYGLLLTESLCFKGKTKAENKEKSDRVKKKKVLLILIMLFFN